MRLGIIGLGRMGANMAWRLARAGHQVVGYDPQDAARGRSARENVATVASLRALVDLLAAPRALWLMVPAGRAVDETLDALLPLLRGGDTIVDGGNSHYRDTLRRAARLRQRQLHYVDCGTSGGIRGLAQGYSLMLGGDAAAIAALQPILEALAPAADRGWGRVGPSGSGHFVKMVHNGIEYGLMQAYAEGFSILQHRPDFELDLAQIAAIWGHGSVVRSWLLELVGEALAADPALAELQAWVDDSGAGRWTVAEALALDVPAPIITAALIERLRSRDRDSFADKLLAAMRAEFGGHPVKKAGG